MNVLQFFITRISNLYRRYLVFIFKLLSDIPSSQFITRNQPVLVKGKGSVLFGKNVEIGYRKSPHFVNSYCYLEARNNETRIEIGSNVKINNNFSICAEGPGVVVGDNCLIGHSVSISDSDFHELDPKKRLLGEGEVRKGKVTIEQNVFIGSHVNILKSVTIGEGAVIAQGAVVSKNIPRYCVAGGNPAKVIREL
ncbi:MAG: acyltransferase [Paraglaciecola sp.]